MRPRLSDAVDQLVATICLTAADTIEAFPGRRVARTAARLGG